MLRLVFSLDCLVPDASPSENSFHMGIFRISINLHQRTICPNDGKVMGMFLWLRIAVVFRPRKSSAWWPLEPWHLATWLWCEMVHLNTLLNETEEIKEI